MAKVRDVNSLVGMLERGFVPRTMNAEFAEILAKLGAMSETNPKKKFKGTLKLELGITLADGMIEITAQVEKKLPKVDPSRGVFFIDNDGEVSTEHPKQPDMFKPREAGSEQ